MMSVETRRGECEDAFSPGPPLRLPDEDALCLVGVPPCAVEKWALDRAQVSEEYTRALRSTRNATAPINRYLPTEVLMHVFASISPKTLNNVRLMHVCRSWRAILGMTTEFWVDMLSLVQLWDIPDLLKVALAMSSPRPLAVRAAPPAVYPSEFMIPHLYRITDLRVATANVEFHDLYRLLQKGHFSNLERLRLVSLDLEGALSDGPPVFEEESLPCTDASLPRLKRLELSPGFVDERLVVSSIESLHILSPDHGLTWLPKETVASPQVLLRVLRRCARNLVSLDVESALPDDDWASVGHSALVELPVLGKLSMATEDADLVESFLGAIAIPPSSSLNIVGEGRCRTIALRDLLSEHHSLTALDNICVSATYNTIWIFATRDNKQLLKLRLPRSAEPDIAAAVARVFHQTRTIVQATLSCAWDSSVTHAQALSLLDMFPHVARLTILHCPTSLLSKSYPANDLLLLSALASASANSAAVACPALEELAITGLDRQALLDPQALARHVAAVLEQRRAALGRPLSSLTLDFDLQDDPYFSYEGDIAARCERMLLERLKTLADDIIVRGR